MKILNIISKIFYAVAIVLIPVSLFEVNGNSVLGIIGYSSLLAGGICTFVCRYLKYKKARKDNSDEGR